MNHGRIGHKKSDSEVARDKQIWYIVYKMKRTSWGNWKKVFNILTEGMDDIDEVRKEVWKRMQH